MNGVDVARSFGTAVRPGIVLSLCLIGGVVIGKNFDKPVEGLAGGIATAAIINGLLNWNDVRSSVS